MKSYAKVIVHGSPISKSNFKLSNLSGRAILPYNSGKYHDRYAIYEETIAYETRLQNPDVVLSESLIAILKVYYKSKKRHPDTTNIPKSIFDGIEKSGLIINDAQITKILIEEYYDSKNPRFELELFGESNYCINYEVKIKPIPTEAVEYSPPSNKKFLNTTISKKESKNSNNISCDICGKLLKHETDVISANKGNTLICKPCFKKAF